MNTSPSPTISSPDPLRAPSEVVGVHSARPSDEDLDNSFDALYQQESESLDDETRYISLNNNNLDRNFEDQETALAKPKGSVNAPGTILNAQEQALDLDTEEPLGKDSLEEAAIGMTIELANDDQNTETELLHGIGVALPSAPSRSKAGEILPQGGKELPLDTKVIAQESLAREPIDELGRQQVVAKDDNEFQVHERLDTIRANDRLKHVSQNSLKTEPSFNEFKLETNLGKTAAGPLVESLPLMPTRAPLESAPLLTFPTSPTAPISAAETGAAQKLAAIVETAASTDISASARSNSLDWSSALGDKVHWMRNANISTAELHLHPAELGSIEIKIVTEDQQTRVSFITSSASARDIIEESMPKLRDLLADSGLELDQSDISHQETGHENSKEAHRALAEDRTIETEMDREFTITQAPPRIGQIDHYV